jgi:integral membrane protein (TIGR00529 family)
MILEMIISVPALAKVICVFGLVLILNRAHMHLSFSLLMGSLVLGLWMRLGPLRLVQGAFFSLARPETIGLILIVGSILALSRLMKESGHLDRIVKSFAKLSRDHRTAGVVMPALIGLLPMPGGALFSAPMVETAFCGHSMTGETKTAVNYWFRHIWEYWWPLYPGVILAVALLDVDAWRFMAVMAPMTLVTVLAGYVFLLKPLGKMAGNEVVDPSWSGLKEFLWEIMPVLIVGIVIVALAGLGGVMTLLGVRAEIPGTVSILPGLIISTIWVCAVNHISSAQFRSALMDREVLSMISLIAAIMIFKGIMMDSQAVLQIRDELGAYEIPLILIILIMPFLSGLVTGIAIGFVGTAFPVIIPLFQTQHAFDYLSCAALAYTSGYMGMMLSPVHLCFLVTKDYFKASLMNSYRYIFWPAMTVLSIAIARFWISRAF